MPIPRRRPTKKELEKLVYGAATQEEAAAKRKAKATLTQTTRRYFGLCHQKGYLKTHSAI